MVVLLASQIQNMSIRGKFSDFFVAANSSKEVPEGMQPGQTMRVKLEDDEEVLGPKERLGFYEC